MDEHLAFGISSIQALGRNDLSTSAAVAGDAPMSWISVWNAAGHQVVHDTKALSLAAAARENTTFLIEGSLAGKSDKPVRVWAGQSGDLSFQVYRMPDGALQFLHRGLNAKTDPDLIGPNDSFKIIYSACANPRGSRIEIHNLVTHQNATIAPYQGEVHCLEDFLPAKSSFFKCMTVVALADHNLSAASTPAYGKGTLINTPAGAIAVEDLVPGMIVDGLVSGPSRIRWCGHLDMLGIGSTAPLLVRAPYFGLSHDIHVSPMTRMLMQGSTVEYLTGKEAIFARAGDMVNRISVIKDQTLPVRRMYQIMTDDHDCVTVGACHMETALLGDILGGQGDALARPMISDLEPVFETIDRATAQTLQAMQAETRRVAA